MKFSAIIAVSALTALAACKDDECSPGDNMASIMAARFVERDLRAPSTAEFGPHHRAVIVDLGSCKYRVTNYVDAQNGFGATIRQTFTIDMERLLSEGSWRSSNLSFQ